MVLAKVQAPGLRSAATLTEGGWSVPGDDLERWLNRVAPLSRFGPADGDSATCCAHLVADLLGGSVIFLRDPATMPEDTVY